MCRVTFEKISITLDNKNVFFGMNDVGKTNFLYALRYVFDKDIRKNNFIDTDFYRKNINEAIEIIVCIDISDSENPDSQKLRSKVKGALLSNQNTVFIKLYSEYNKTEMCGNPILYWGGDLDDLQEIKSKGYYFEIDYLFNVIYIDAYVDLYTLFKKNSNVLLKNDDDTDKEELSNIDEIISDLNNKISSLSGIKNFEEKVTPTYNCFRHDKVEITVKSQISVNGLYSNVVPYIKRENSNDLYPTAGEGRKKLLVYSIYDLLSNETEEKKINIFLIEEPENHLHRAMQMALSHQLFVEEKYKYMFMTTHSSDVMAEMNEVNLVRIFNKNKIDSASSFYTVPSEFDKAKNLLNKKISEAIFADKVLLVEGPSEEALFDKVLFSKNKFYQVDGIHILAVNGIDFKPYVSILSELKIPYVLKTDNDLRKEGNKNYYSPLGFSRINKIISEEDALPLDNISSNTTGSKRKLYKANKEKLDMIRKNYHIYLSKVSLEEDLDEVIHDKIVNYLPKANGDIISYLKEHKKYNMVELTNSLTDEDCDLILNHYNFECLADILK